MRRKHIPSFPPSDDHGAHEADASVRGERALYNVGVVAELALCVRRTRSLRSLRLPGGARPTTPSLIAAVFATRSKSTGRRKVPSKQIGKPAAAGGVKKVRAASFPAAARGPALRSSRGGPPPPPVQPRAAVGGSTAGRCRALRARQHGLRANRAGTRLTTRFVRRRCHRRTPARAAPPLSPWHRGAA
jgi:hypothetical protein